MASELSGNLLNSASQLRPATIRPVLEFRQCLYLHLNTAKLASNTAGEAKRWGDKNGQSHPVFEVEGKKRWVLIRGYFDEAVYGSKWCLIYKLTTKGIRHGKTLPNHKQLGPILPDSTATTFVQRISECYPLNLIEQASSAPPSVPDRMTLISLCKVLDSCSFKS